MAEIHMERRRGMGWMWALLAILLIALVVWMFWPRRDPELVPVATATTATIIDPVVVPLAATDATIATIVASPQPWVGREFSGVVTVAEVPSDRGFWIGTVRDAYLPQVPGGNLAQSTEEIAREQPVYLLAGETAIDIVQPGQSS